MIWTIGHSTRTLEAFIGLLKEFQIHLLADIRSYPGSRRCPQFNSAPLKASLAGANIRYIHMNSLGGRRRVRPDSHNTGWIHPAFRGYADYMETVSFKEAIPELEDLASHELTAIMCAEALWWRCHRGLVSDYLKWRGWTILHILGPGKTEEHPFTKPARIEDGELSYRLPEDLDGSKYQGSLDLF